jgi:GT2 family glycosyltransferase
MLRGAVLAAQRQFMPIKVSVVIPTAQRADMLHRCLQSLRRQAFSNFETIIVSDGAGEWARALAEEYNCLFVGLPTSQGFAHAVNAGAARASGEYLMLLNDDVDLDCRWLSTTVSVLDENPAVGFCCGKLYRPDGLIDDTGDAISLGGSAWRLGHGRKDSAAFDFPQPVIAFPGTAALIRTSLWRQLDGFDETFVAYLEDIDLSLRLARNGVQGLYIPDATAVHRGGATSGGVESPAVFRFLTANQMFIFIKHYPSRLWPRVLWAQILWAAMAAKKGRLRAYCSGVARALGSLPQVLRERRRKANSNPKDFLFRLMESDKEIYADVSALERSSHDAFWRLYFLLFPPRPTGRTGPDTHPETHPETRMDAGSIKRGVATGEEGTERAKG